MKNIKIVVLIISSLFVFNYANAQSKTVSESVEVNNETKLALDFTFANLITFKTWDKKEVLVEVIVEIQGGKYNDIFSLSTEKFDETIHIAMDKNMWKKINKKDRNGNWSTQLDYTVYLPKSLAISSNTISGNYEAIYFGNSLKLKTISGEIDLTIPRNHGLDFRSKTVTGEIYSDIEITYPDGREGLNQIVGQNIRGRIRKGGTESAFETVSGNIFLRKG